MDGITILERIVSEEGSCNWACASVCASCPLGKLARYESGGFMSCVESLDIDGLSEIEADAKYKLAAINKLADLAISKIIEEE